jgi:hypothetical protein
MQEAGTGQDQHRALTGSRMAGEYSTVPQRVSSNLSGQLFFSLIISMILIKSKVWRED